MATNNPLKPPEPPVKLPDPDEGGSVVLERRTERVKPPQMYQVVMINDDYTPMEFVVEILEVFFSMNREKATQVMLAVHHAENPSRWKSSVRRVFAGRGRDEG